MNFIAIAEKVFKVERPNFFVEPPHDLEGREHNATLMSSSIESIGIPELGNQGWDPLCFCSEEGMKYFFPALIRLSIETIKDDFYFEQLLFHLGYQEQENRFLKSCSKEQKEYISIFLDFMINNHAEEIDYNLSTDSAIDVHQLWYGK